MSLKFQRPSLEDSLAAFEKEYRYLWGLRGWAPTQDRLDNLQSYIFKCWHDEKDYHIVGDKRAMMIYGWEPVYRQLYIADLWVEPQFRRQGLAQKLVQFAIEEQCQRDSEATISLYVLKNNFPAIALYQKMGFIVKAGSQDEAGFEMEK